KRRDAGRQRGDDTRVAVDIYTMNRAAAIADPEVPRPVERQTERRPELRGEDLRLLRPGIDAIDRPLEAARDVERAVTSDGDRRGIRNVDAHRLAHAVTAHAEQRDGHAVVAAAAERRVDVAVAIECRVVHLMATGRQRRADLG